MGGPPRFWPPRPRLSAGTSVQEKSGSKEDQKDEEAGEGSSGSQSQPPGGASGGRRPTEEDWELARWEKRMRIREAAKTAKVLVGSAKDTGLECGVTTKVIFIYNVKNSFTPEKVRTIMTNKAVEAIKIRQTSHKAAVNKSFRIVIKEEDFKTCWAEGFWNEGILCREWID